MNDGYLEEAVGALLKRLRSDGYSDEMVKNAEWILGVFAKWCEKEGVASVGREVNLPRFR